MTTTSPVWESFVDFCRETAYNLFTKRKGDRRMLREGRPRRSTRNKYIEWLIFTVIMGATPSIIRWLVFIYFEQPLTFVDFRTEVFFLSIVLLVDSLKNTGLKWFWGIASFVMLLFCIFVYAVVFFDASHLLSRSPSGLLVERSAVVALILGFLFDFRSISEQ
jgi:hypothetical protein